MNFTKTILEAIKYWVENRFAKTEDWVENRFAKTEDLHEQIQTDWNQNDETAVNYIKNRPIYEEETFNIRIEEQNVIIDETGSGKLLGESFFDNGIYRITIDGITYDNIKTNYYEEGDPGFELFINDISIIISPKLKITADSSFAGEHIFKIEQKVVFVKQLDNKFLPIKIYAGEGEDSLILNSENNTASGKSSHAEGSLTEASGGCSHAEGSFTEASGDNSHAEGNNTTASGKSSHAEGINTTASGDYSHAEGDCTTAFSKSQHVQGKYNKKENIEVTEECNHPDRFESGYASSSYTFDNNTCLFRLGDDATYATVYEANEKYWIKGNSNGQEMYYISSYPKAIRYTCPAHKYAHIVGNGTLDNHSNAHTLDWNGVGWYQGGLQVGGNAQDDGAKNVLLEGDAIPVPETAEVGQTIVVKSVDENGKPAEWEAADGALKTDILSLDNTLSVEGYAADAKAVGDAISKISGGNADYVGVEPAEDDMPKVFITGVKPTTKDDVLAEMEYVSKTDRFHAYLNIKCQGSSSMSYAKKNFTVKLYSDEARETKLKKSFKDWNHNGNKYVLKANYIDHSHARNIVSARLWNEVVKSRPDYDSLPEEMRNSPRNGAVDGFPIKVYYNGTYEGVYTWNIGKDDWQWGMDEDNANHVLLCAETNDNGNKTATPCNFRALWSGTDENHWTVEVGTNSTAVKTSLNNLIQFVMDNDGDAFRNGIGRYLDIQSAIDYYIFMYEICGLDGLGKNLLLATYDGVKWICGAYDMDSTFGLFWNGTKFVAPTYRCPEDYQETYSLLWERIEANLLPELKARQAYLRKTVLSYSNMVTHVERFMDIIGKDLYAEDLTVYSSIPSGSTNNIKQIRDFIRDRQVYVDAEFAAMGESVPCTGISLDKSSLTFTAEGTQTITATVTPDGCTDVITWESDNSSVATVNGGVVTSVANGSAVITARCGNYSATCSVAVSGIAEPVECTGITLDKSELTFDGEGTQTITATVTPSDTTDSVVWVSSNPAAAFITVEGNVCTVQSVGNGNAVITATCGSQVASCYVSVSGYSVVNVLSNAVWTSGQNLDGGNVSTGGDNVSDYIAVTPSTPYIIGNVNDGIFTWFKISYFDSDKTYISKANLGGWEVEGIAKLNRTVVTPKKCAFIRVSVSKGDFEDIPECVAMYQLNESGVENLLRDFNAWSETANYTLKDGVVSSGGQRVGNDYIPVSASHWYEFTFTKPDYAWGVVAQYDAEYNFVVQTGNGTPATRFQTKENTAYIKLAYNPPTESEESRNDLWLVDIENAIS